MFPRHRYTFEKLNKFRQVHRDFEDNNVPFLYGNVICVEADVITTQLIIYWKEIKTLFNLEGTLRTEYNFYTQNNISETSN